MFIFSPLTKIRSSQVNQNFTDLSTGAGDVDGNNLQLYRAEVFSDMVVTGLVWSSVSGLNGTMTTGIAYIKDSLGITRRVTPAVIATKALTANKDTYVDLGADGTLYYTEVANDTASPTLTVNRMRIAIIVTNATVITIVNQGQLNITAPTVSSVILTVSDSLGNLVYNQNPIPTLIGSRKRLTTFSTTSSTQQQMNELAMVVKVPNGARRKIRITVKGRALIVEGTSFVEVCFYDGVFGGTPIRRSYVGAGANGQHYPSDISFVHEITGSGTIRMGIASLNNANLVHYQGGIDPYEIIQMTVELI